MYTDAVAVPNICYLPTSLCLRDESKSKEENISTEDQFRMAAFVHTCNPSPWGTEASAEGAAGVDRGLFPF